jgi:hypothetical protein
MGRRTRPVDPRFERCVVQLPQQKVRQRDVLRLIAHRADEREGALSRQRRIDHGAVGGANRIEDGGPDAVEAVSVHEATTFGHVG